MVKLCFVFLLLSLEAAAQPHLYISVQDMATHEPLSSVSITLKNNVHKAAISDLKGNAVLKDLPNGDDTILFSLVGYKDTFAAISVPGISFLQMNMVANPRALNEVIIIASTRNNDRIENATTKVEVLGQEEMNEESTLKPGNIASILGDVSGVQLQQSSPISGNTNVRIQGLEGKYTQILRDGIPLYEGYSGGFGILTIPPLDLRQIELIKGSSSTLYGGGAIAGLINLISKKPSATPDASFLVNQTTLKETNFNAYYGQKWKKIGLTLFAAENIQKAVDVDKDGFSDVPKTNSMIIHPAVFFYPSTTTWISLGWSGSFENRSGGDMIAIKSIPDPAHPYYEKNLLDRNSFTLLGETKINPTLSISVKGNLSVFARKEITNEFVFEGQQNNYYGELALSKKSDRHFIIGGVNTTGDRFTPSVSTPVPVGEFSNNTIGLFLQDSWQIFLPLKLEVGLRGDHHQDYGSFLLPRIALFYKLTEKWGLRAGIGTGYKTPNALAPQIRDYPIYQIMPITANVGPERSTAGNLEFNYKTHVGEEGTFFINQAFFLTRITDPIVGSETSLHHLVFANEQKPVVTSGSDTYTQLQIPSWEFYLGYTYSSAVRKYLISNRFMPLTPKHRAAATVLYEKEGNWRIGIEASYNGYQYREDYSKTPGYLFMAVMAEKKFGPKWSLVLNCENLFDERQSKYEKLYTGTITNPSFNPLWAPIDGRIINLSVRYQPFARDAP